MAYLAGPASPGHQGCLTQLRASLNLKEGLLIRDDCSLDGRWVFLWSERQREKKRTRPQSFTVDSGLHSLI